MRHRLIIVAFVLLCVAGSVAAFRFLPQEAQTPSGATATAQKPTDAVKPNGASDSCRWANDNECDEPDIGTGACALRTDYSDCRALREGEDDSCRWANDGECDEPNFGTGACVQGTDRTDCGAIAWLRNQSDRCDTAFNGVCEEPGEGRGGACAARTDRADCRGRERPLTINDHYFGRDDRVLVPVTDLPWRFMGALSMSAGETCTATLIARDVIVTAAHCIHTDNGVNASARFTTADGRHQAQVTHYLIDPNFNYIRFNRGDEIDGLDWALLRLSAPLGDQVGYAGYLPRGASAAMGQRLMQAGYSWDTGENLSGNLDCRVLQANADNTFSHNCDTTRGDSGSAFVIRQSSPSSRSGYVVIGTDSNFRSNPGGPFIYIAVSSAAWATRAPDFIAGRTGTPVGQSAPGRK